MTIYFVAHEKAIFQGLFGHTPGGHFQPASVI